MIATFTVSLFLRQLVSDHLSRRILHFLMISDGVAGLLSANFLIYFFPVLEYEQGATIGDRRT